MNIVKFFRKGFLLHDGFSIGKFQDSGKLYQQLELEYLNQRGDETCMSVLSFYLMFNMLC